MVVVVVAVGVGGAEERSAEQQIRGRMRDAGCGRQLGSSL